MKTVFVLLFTMALSVSRGSDNNDAATKPQQAVTLSSQAPIHDADAVTIPRMLSYQGKLTDSLGNPVADTTYSVVFRLYTVPSGGSAFWNETQTVRTRSGLFSVLLGSVTPIGSMPDAGAVYLGMAVAGGTELTPRLRIASAAYAYLTERAANADLLQGQDTSYFAKATHTHAFVDSSRIAAGSHRLQGKDTTGFVRTGQANSVTSGMIVDGTIAGADLNQMGAATGQVLKWTGSAWAPRNDSVGGGGTGDNAWVRIGSDSVLYTIRRLGLARGGANNMLHGGDAYTHVNFGNACTTGTAGQNRAYCVVAGGQGNVAGASWTTVGGGSYNRATGANATVAGGAANQATLSAGTVSGGANNRATGQYAVVAGGSANTASGAYASVAGGNANVASGYCAAVVGGESDTAVGFRAAAFSGYANKAGDAVEDTGAVICGGDSNQATGIRSFVGGGKRNSAAGNAAAVLGGSGNEATGDSATIGGGSRNKASGYRAVVCGGIGNEAQDVGSIVVGGYENIASGRSSFIGGGFGNYASGLCGAVLGGQYNRADGSCAVCVGGGGNGARGPVSTVVGGSGNEADSEYTFVGGGTLNRAAGQYAVVTGGGNNTAVAIRATIGGGQLNHAVGRNSTIPGGYADTVLAVDGFAGNGYCHVLAGHNNSAAFNGQTTTASNQTRVGTLSKASGTFTIDHPLDPYGRILNHYFIEGPEMLNVYRGSVVLDAAGRAEVSLPDYFDALNRNPHIQLTGVGTFEVYVAKKVTDNRFVIGGKPGTEVFWTVTGERKDVSAEVTRRMMPVEQAKTGGLEGRMLDDDFLAGCMDQLVREGKAAGIGFRTAAGRAKYERMKQVTERQ
ncbi:MAG: hypothetical protein ABIK86_02610 [candidate division WOR-3 bacterium]